jgi:outer membrane protein assembly factor BamE (lipoprotein component of BamABCDE complex)
MELRVQYLKDVEMKRIPKSVLVISVILVTIGFSELLREYVVYSRYTVRLVEAREKVQPGMSKIEVLSFLGNPDQIRRAEEDTWYWDAGVHQGYLLSKLQLATVKGHFCLTVRFDGRKSVNYSWAGVN